MTNALNIGEAFTKVCGHVEVGKAAAAGPEVMARLCYQEILLATSFIGIFWAALARFLFSIPSLR